MKRHKVMATSGGLAVLALVASAPIVVADAATSTDTTVPAGSAEVGEDCPEDRRGGELTFAVFVEINGGFDPTIGGSTGAQGGHERGAVFDHLMRYDAETGTFTPWMAESLEPNDDLTQWTLTLRDGVMFDSGNPVTAEAVRYSIERHVAEGSPSVHRQNISMIDSMDVVDDRTLVFTLVEPWGDFPALLSNAPGMVVDPAVVESIGAEGLANDPQGAGAGPYRVARYTPGEEIVLEAREDYWGGAPCIETIRFVPIPNEETKLDSFLTGDVDVAYLRAASSTATLEEQGFELGSNMNPHYQYGGMMVLINHGARGQNRPGSDVRVRQAIAHALDAELIDQRVNGGVGQPGTAILGEASPYFSPEFEGPAYDPDLATQLLEEAKADGYDGSLRLSCYNNPEQVEWAITVEALLEAVGFTVELDNARQLGEVVTEWAEADYDANCLALNNDDASPWASLNRVLGEGRLESTRTGYVSDRMDEALGAVRVAATPDERQQALVQVQEVWNEEVPHAITGHYMEVSAWQDNVSGLAFTNTGVVLFDDAFVTG